MIRLEILLHPSSYAQTIVAHPPLGAVTLWLLILIALVIVAVGGIDARRSYEGDRQELSTFWSALAVIPVCFLTFWLLLTHLTQALPFA